MTPDQQAELDAYFWRRAGLIVVVLVLFTAAGLLIGPWQERRNDSFRYRSDKTAAVVTGKKEEPGGWFGNEKHYVVTYEYVIDDVKFVTTEDVEYRECFDAMVEGQQAYVYFHRQRPEQSHTECHLKHMTASRPVP